MNNIINLCASLILTILGFILPILTILLSLFSEGAKALTSRYENEKRQSDENIANEIKKKESGLDLDYIVLEKTLKTLKSNKKVAENKLKYLKPASLVIKISIPLIISFVCLISLFNIKVIWMILVLVFVSFVGFVYGIYFTWKSLIVLIEVSKIINESKKDSEDKIIELLSNIANNGGNHTFLKPENINIKFNNEILKNEKQFDFSINVNHNIPISIINNEDMMAKNIEIGLIFPPDFLIEKTTNIDSFYTEEIKQIIRFKEEFVHSNENKIRGEIKITFLKAGVHDVTAFVKGENFKSKYIKFKIKIIN